MSFPASIGDAGKLAYKHGNGALAYKKAGAGAGSLIFKADFSAETTITFAWGSDGKDLDICAYWNDAPDLKVGYGYSGGGSESESSYSSGPFHITYSGDQRGADTSEWVRIIKHPWSGGPATFTVRLNFFGYNSSDHPADTCAVIVTQNGGETKILYDVPCGTGSGSKATDSHPGVKVSFDSSGFLDNVETIQGA